MGLFSFFKKKKTKQTKPQKHPVVTTTILGPNGLDYSGFPSLEKYRVNPDGRRYDDTYFTGTGYFLREILLLIWWGRTKNPRKSTSQPPRYFFYEYHLDTKKTTDRFILEGLIEIDEQNRKVLTDRGRSIYNDFDILWEIHNYKGYVGELPNLDKVFQNWDYNSYRANNILLEIRHLSDIIKFHENLLLQLPKDDERYYAYQLDIARDKETIQELFKEHERLTESTDKRST